MTSRVRSSSRATMFTAPEAPAAAKQPSASALNRVSAAGSTSRASRRWSRIAASPPAQAATPMPWTIMLDTARSWSAAEAECPAYSGGTQARRAPRRAARRRRAAGSRGRSRARSPSRAARPSPSPGPARTTRPARPGPAGRELGERHAEDVGEGEHEQQYGAGGPAQRPPARRADAAHRHRREAYRAGGHEHAAASSVPTAITPQVLSSSRTTGSDQVTSGPAVGRSTIPRGGPPCPNSRAATSTPAAQAAVTAAQSASRGGRRPRGRGRDAGAVRPFVRGPVTGPPLRRGDLRHHRTSNAPPPCRASSADTRRSPVPAQPESAARHGRARPLLK